MRLSPLPSVDRTIYQNVYLAPHFSALLFQVTNILRKYLITFTLINFRELGMAEGLKPLAKMSESHWFWFDYFKYLFHFSWAGTAGLWCKGTFFPLFFDPRLACWPRCREDHESKLPFNLCFIQALKDEGILLSSFSVWPVPCGPRCPEKQSSLKISLLQSPLRFRM